LRGLLAAAAFVVTFLPNVTSAQTSNHAPADIADGPQLPGDAAWSRATQLLSAGDAIRAALDGGPSVRGAFRATDDQSITLEVAGRDQQLNRARVRRLSVARGTRQRRHENIGMAIGAVFGALIWGRQCGRPRDNCLEESMLYFGGPMLTGGIIGHLLPARTAWREIYVRQ
jgi:hypothetical protein